LKERSKKDNIKLLKKQKDEKDQDNYPLSFPNSAFSYQLPGLLEKFHANKYNPFGIFSIFYNTNILI